jgi:hypothetical protein
METSILQDGFRPAAIATLANEYALNDLECFFRSLELWSTSDYPTIYLYCNSIVTQKIPSYKYKGQIHINEALNAYTGLNRSAMESRRGLTFPTLFGDFTAEKISLIEWALESLSEEDKSRGVLFCDADIFFLGALPVIPSGSTLAISPHLIKEIDSSRYGYYNAGFLWTNSATVLTNWRAACHRSRFFEQAAIEELENETTYIFNKNNNYGWWRLWQGNQHYSELKKEWSINRSHEEFSGICVDSKPLGSVHTHWFEDRDMAVVQFNSFVYSYLRILSKNPKVNALVKLLDVKAPWLKTFHKD